MHIFQSVCVFKILTKILKYEIRIGQNAWHTWHSCHEEEINHRHQKLFFYHP